MPADAPIPIQVIQIVVFAILIIVNFIVITKGSGRIAEVAARLGFEIETHGRSNFKTSLFYLYRFKPQINVISGLWDLFSFEQNSLKTSTSSNAGASINSSSNSSSIRTGSWFSPKIFVNSNFKRLV
jgi:hypothetical protein